MRLLISAIALLLIQAAPTVPSNSSNRPVPRTRKIDSKPQTQSNDGTQNTETDKAPSEKVTVVIEQEKPLQVKEEPANKSSKEDENTTINNRLMIFTGILAAVAFFQLLTFGYQIQSTHKIAQKELRAYVLPVSAVREIVDGTPKLKVVIHNSGKTPAIRCVSEVFRGIAPAVKPLPPLPDTSKFTSVRSESFVTPGKDVWMVDDDPLSPEEARDIKRGMRAIYAIGTISYQDVFNKKHVSRYQFMCSGNNLDTGTFVFDDEGNGIDQEDQNPYLAMFKDHIYTPMRDQFIRFWKGSDC